LTYEITLDDDTVAKLEKISEETSLTVEALIEQAVDYAIAAADATD
jgi:predicted transcriptional regulator